MWWWQQQVFGPPFHVVALQTEEVGVGKTMPPLFLPSLLFPPALFYLSLIFLPPGNFLFNSSYLWPLYTSPHEPGYLPAPAVPCFSSLSGQIRALVGPYVWHPSSSCSAKYAIEIKHCWFWEQCKLAVSSPSSNVGNLSHWETWSHFRQTIYSVFGTGYYCYIQMPSYLPDQWSHGLDPMKRIKLFYNCNYKRRNRCFHVKDNACSE